MAASLNHPNVVTVYEVGTDGNQLFIAMEYLPKSLQTLLDERKTLPVDEAVAILRQAALGLQSAHGRGITHRDIKPHDFQRRYSYERNITIQHLVEHDT